MSIQNPKNVVNYRQANRMEDGSMKFLPKDLRDEFEIATRKLPDIREIGYPLINSSDVLRAHYVLVDYFTDRSANANEENMLNGIRDANLLGSAIGRQCVSFGGKTKYKSAIEICSALFISLTKNHPFVDGNKRTALLTLLYELDRYGYMPQVGVKQFERLVLAVAKPEGLKSDYKYVYAKFATKGDADVKTVTYLLRRMTKKKDHSYHINVTMREFCHALSGYGVKFNEDGNKMKFEYTKPAKWRYPQKKLMCTTPFHGWTRTVGAGTARDTIESLDLYAQFADYKSFLQNTDPLYKLVEDFQVPLRRLKDE